MSQPLLDHGRLGRDGPQHCRVLGGVEAADSLNVADEDVAVVRLGDAVANASSVSIASRIFCWNMGPGSTLRPR